MESNENLLSIPCNEAWVMENFLEKFNRIYKSTMSIVREEDRDGVNFFIINYEELNNDQILNWDLTLQVSYCIYEMRKR